MIDITDYRSKLNANLQQFVQLLSPLSTEARRFKQDNEWNLLEILEHVWLTEQTVVQMITKGSGSFSDDLEIFGFDKLKKVLVDYRHRKVKAPQGMEPKGAEISLPDLLVKLHNGRNSLINDIQSARLWMSAEVHVNPMLGEMTVIDWLHFILLHSERHYLQMQEQMQRYNAVTKDL